MYHCFPKIIREVSYTFVIKSLVFFLDSFRHTCLYVLAIKFIYLYTFVLVFLQYLTNGFFHGKVWRVLYCLFNFCNFRIIDRKKKCVCEEFTFSSQRKEYQRTSLLLSTSPHNSVILVRVCYILNNRDRSLKMYASLRRDGGIAEWGDI